MRINANATRARAEIPAFAAANALHNTGRTPFPQTPLSGSVLACCRYAGGFGARLDGPFFGGKVNDRLRRRAAIRPVNTRHSHDLIDFSPHEGI
jgi:hypothetical protein